MTRIVFYNHTGKISGAERMLLMGLGHLPRDLFDLALACPEGGPLQAAARQLGVPVYVSREVMARFTYNPVLLFRYALSILGTLRDLRSTFRSSTADIVHANTVRAGIVATVATLGMRTHVVWHNHDMLPRHPITFAIRLLAHSSKRVRVVGCSAAAAQTLRPVMRNAKDPTVIPNGTETDYGEFNEDARKAKRKELKVLPAEFAVGIIGQLTPRKGQLELIRAFADIKAQFAEAVLVICGAPIFNNDHHYLERLHQEVTRLELAGSVRFLGQRSDAPVVIGAMDVLVLNSRAEPFGLTLIEAMTMGTPVVSTNCGGPAEIIRHGVDGEIVELGDQAALVRAIVRLGRDPGLRSRYGAAAAERARRTYSREQYIAEWSNLYQEMCHQDRTCEHPPAAKRELNLQAGGGCQ